MLRNEAFNASYCDANAAALWYRQGFANTVCLFPIEAVDSFENEVQVICQKVML